MAGPPRGADDASGSPLAWDTTAAPSAFDPADWQRYSAALGRPAPSLPELAVLSVLPEVLALGEVRGGLGAAEHPWGVVERAGATIALVLAPKGSPASGVLEEMLALGVRAVVFTGGCGALTGDLAPGTLLAPTRALRDEGVSPHYLAPGRWAHPSPRLLARLRPAAGVAGATWTTHAHFRQTLPRLEAFREEGCVAVEAEAASLFAVGAFRRRDVAALLVVGDSIAGGRFTAPVPPPERAGDLLDAATRALTSLAAEAGTGAG